MRKSGTSGKERRQGPFPSCFPDFQIISCLSEERLLGQAGFNLEGGGLALRSRFGEAWASVAGFLESGQKRLSRRLRPTRRRTGLHPFFFGGRGRPPSMCNASGASFCSAPRRGAIGRAYGGPSSVFEFSFLGFGYWMGHRYRNRYRDRDRKKKKATGTIAIPMAIPNSDTDSDLDESNPKASAGGKILNTSREYPITNKEYPMSK